MTEQQITQVEKPFCVVLDYQGNEYYLRSTVWTSNINRATTFETREAAQAQLNKAKPFMKASQYKAARITEI